MVAFLRWLWLAACLAALPAIGAVHSSSGTGALRAQAPLELRIVVPLVMRLQMLEHPAYLDVTAEDIRRGELVVEGPSIEVAMNGRAGYAMSGEVTGATFESARIEGLPRPVEVGHDAGAPLFLATPSGNRERYRVTYRMRLSPQAQPGRHPWPVHLALQRP